MTTNHTLSPCCAPAAGRAQSRVPILQLHVPARCAALARLRPLLPHLTTHATHTRRSPGTRLLLPLPPPPPLLIPPFSFHPFSFLARHDFDCAATVRRSACLPHSTMMPPCSYGSAIRSGCLPCSSASSAARYMYRLSSPLIVSCPLRSARPRWRRARAATRRGCSWASLPA